MKYVITGSTGHISKPLAEQLIAKGNDVTIISSNAEKTKEIEALGGKAAIGSVEDVAFLTSTFSGADAVYTMVPPKMDAADWKGHIHIIGTNLAEAIRNSGVRKVVNLSSVGAHMAEGCGPVSGLYRAEQEFNKLQGVDVLHLRPGYFYLNLYANIGLIKHLNIMGGNYGDNTKMVMVHPNDIAAVAAEALLSLSFAGISIRYIASDERTTNDIAKILGDAIGKPGIPWINFKDEESLGGMLQAGLTPETASNYVEMGHAIATGEMSADYELHKTTMGPTKLEDFAKEFAIAFAH